MKVLIVGASGGIGSQALVQSLSHPQITKVVAFSRRALSVQHSKLENILIKDFSKWPEDILRAHADAAGMIWYVCLLNSFCPILLTQSLLRCMGSYNGSETVDLEFPVAFMDSMIKVLDAKTRKTPFKYVHLSGKFVRQDQNLNLWWGDRPRKLKVRLPRRYTILLETLTRNQGLSDTRALEVAEAHANVWQTRVVKPGGVAHHWWMSPAVWLLGDNWAVRGDELGAFMTHLVVDGQAESPISENARIARKGRELLQEPKA